MIGRYLMVFAFAVPLIAISQPAISVDGTSALIGDHIELTLSVPLPGGSKWINANIVPADTVETIEIVESLPPVTNANGLVKQWTIAVFDTGNVRIPPIPVIVSTGGKSDTFLTNDIPLRIEGVLDSAGMAPIKPLVYEQVRLSDYLKYALIALVLILLVLGAIAWRHRSKKQPVIVEISDPKTPAQLAFEKLHALDDLKLWQKGEVKTYHSQLSHIVREYLEGRFQIQALESTTSEIIAQLKRAGLESQMIEETRKMMQVEDLVKFAKARPPESVHAEHMTFATEFVRKTQQTVEQTATDA